MTNRADPPHRAVDLPLERLAVLCSRWEIVELELFGSRARGRADAGSDVDLMVTFRDEAHPSLFDLARLHLELEELFGRDVDLVTRRAVEASSDTERRREILRSARTLYAA